MRFDLRLADPSTARAQYAAALEMVAWAETRGCAFSIVSEHHGVPDGYLPSPVPMVAAMAARTTTMHFAVAAALLPLYDPVRLAEDIAVVDHLSGGRVSWVLALGYRPEEYALFGVDWERRGKLADEKLAVLLAALDGEPRAAGEHAVSVTPLPAARPLVSWGGGSPAAARRAARFGLSFFGQTDHGGLAEIYAAECARLGREPGMCVVPSPDEPTTVFVADDLDTAWDELGPYLLHDATTYAAWNADSPPTASISRATTVDALRAEQAGHRIWTVDEAVAHVRGGGMLALHPLCGGLPPELAWPCLERVAEQVVPALAT